MLSLNLTLYCIFITNRKIMNYFLKGCDFLVSTLQIQIYKYIHGKMWIQNSKYIYRKYKEPNKIERFMNLKTTVERYSMPTGPFCE